VAVNGKIRSRPHYEQSKNLDHSEWLGKLPRNCSPSDIDVVLNDWPTKRNLYKELSSSVATWKEIQRPQLMTQMTAVHGGVHYSVLLKHSVQPPKLIKTVSDIESFQVMFWSDGDWRYSRLLSGGSFLRFVQEWYRSDSDIRKILLTKHAGRQDGSPLQEAMAA
jgi:hypothetical protein